MHSDGGSPSYGFTHRGLLKDHLARTASIRSRPKQGSRYFLSEVDRLVAAQIPAASSVLEIGCGTGQTLGRLRPRIGVGIDLDSRALAEAAKTYPDFTFIDECIEEVDQSGFSTNLDYVCAIGLLEQVYDIHEVLERIVRLCSLETRVVVVSYSRLWQPLFRLAERMNQKFAAPNENWIPVSELRNVAEQVGLEVVKSQSGILAPVCIPFVSRWVNRWLAPLPVFRHLGVVHLTVMRSAMAGCQRESVSVVVPARNERGNIQQIIDRMPVFASEQEIVFVEGGSTDGTWEAISAAVLAHDPIERGFRVSCVQQDGVGKGDAVRTGFSTSAGEIFIILDADLSVPPEELPRFASALTRGCAEFVNGSRLVYAMEPGSMQFLNLLGNRFFGVLFTFLLGQPVRDTLCGTKAISRVNYERIVMNRERFGDFDPFGDFDLLFGAAALNLKIRDQPVHYKARTYGSTNISRFRHGILLFRMSWFAARKIRFT
jgi:SAM-dependent methyltransferase